MDTSRQTVEFPTLDGHTLRGWLFPTKEKGPGIIMTPGINMPKSDLYQDVAEHFQNAGYTTLVYDPRCVGDSDGEPRSEINPAKQSEDIHDVVTFFKTVRTVDPKQIALWGYSLGAAETLAAAALDPRIKLVVAICPTGSPWDPSAKEERKTILTKIMRDRESRLRGNPPFEFPFLGESDANFFNLRTLQGRMAKRPFEAIRTSLSEIPGFRNSLTVQTLLNVASWNILHLVPRISPTPVLLVTAGDEEIQRIKKGCEDIYAALGEPKELYVQKGRGHMDILMYDELFPSIMKVQVDFMKKYFDDDD